MVDDKHTGGFGGLREGEVPIIASPGGRLPPEYEKDGVHYMPSGIVHTCGRCARQLRVTASWPVGDLNGGVWNDDSWFALHRRIGSNEPAPPKFQAWPATRFGRFAFVHLCKSCGDKFNEWLARAD